MKMRWASRLSFSDRYAPFGEVRAGLQSRTESRQSGAAPQGSDMRIMLKFEMHGRKEPRSADYA